ncbi:cytochrome c oxidase subunit 1, partial [Phlyctochytrium bullatum]
MTTLSELTENAILENLKARYSAKHIYVRNARELMLILSQTYTGSILVALNPYENLEIYGTASIRQYSGARLHDNPPHIYALAEQALHNIRGSSENQSVIISGESGAGKSESTKSILANNNSSRFGKFIQVHLDQKVQIVGASIVSYLLEKSRIAKQAPTERNYHVFYEFLSGASDDERGRYKLRTAADYYYLSQSGCTEIEGVNDKKQFEGLKLAMMVLNMGPSEIDGIFRALSAILWIGNISFKEDTSRESVRITNSDVVETIAELLGVDKGKLSETLCFRKLSVRNEVTMVPLKSAQVSFIAKIFRKAEVDSKSETNTKSSKPGTAKLTSGAYFKNQLTNLVTTLAATTPHYIRCIKPNSQKSSFGFDDAMVLGVRGWFARDYYRALRQKAWEAEQERKMAEKLAMDRKLSLAPDRKLSLAIAEGAPISPAVSTSSPLEKVNFEAQQEAETLKIMAAAVQKKKETGSVESLNGGKINPQAPEWSMEAFAEKNFELHEKKKQKSLLTLGKKTTKNHLQNVDEIASAQNINEWIVERLSTSVPKEQLAKSITDQYLMLKGTPAIQAKFLYLETVKGFKYYGTSLFPAKYQGFWTFSENVLLAVSCYGIEFIQEGSREAIMNFTYNEVRTFVSDAETITITINRLGERDEESEGVEVYSFSTIHAEE